MRGGGKFTNLWLGLLTVGLTVLAFLAAVNIYGQSDQNVKLHAYAAANHANSDAISAVSNARITADDKLIAANTALARRINQLSIDRHASVVAKLARDDAVLIKENRIQCRLISKLARRLHVQEPPCT